MRRAPYILILAFAAAFLPGACYPFNLPLKPEQVLEPQKIILNLNLGAYTGKYTVAYYTDGATIKSITTDAGEILIGRPGTDTIDLNLNPDGSLAFRPADGNGFTPIGTYAEFQLINTDAATLGGKYKQEADLNLMNEEWTPVGNEPTPFTGTFNGGGYHIDNLFIDDDTAPVGLFGAVQGLVENVHVRSGSVTGNVNVAGVVSVTVDKGDSHVGTVRLCSNAATITGTAGMGGIVAFHTGIIEGCYNTGAIIASTDIADGNWNVGGIAGTLSYYGNNNSGPKGRVYASYNTGAVTSSYCVGGIVGVSNYGVVIACYNTGTISGNDGRSGSYAGVGGVVGCFWPGSGQITACYNIGSIIALNNTSTYIGAVAGYVSGPTGVNANYWETSTATNGIGPGSVANTTTPFSGTAWPTTGIDTEWGTDNGVNTGTSGNYWKSLGGWNGGTPIYPRLWYEE